MVSNRGRAKGLKGILSTYVGNTGYIKLKIYKPRQKGVKRVTINICMHQLVAMAFLDHVPCGNKIVVDHIDNDDNRLLLFAIGKLDVEAHEKLIARSKQRYQGIE